MVKILKNRKPGVKNITNKEFEGYLVQQTEFNAMMIQRIAVLERVLLQVKNVSVEEFQEITNQVHKEFSDSVNSVIANLISRG
jgi:hypothetical protein